MTLKVFTRPVHTMKTHMKLKPKKETTEPFKTMTLDFSSGLGVKKVVLQEKEKAKDTTVKVKAQGERELDDNSPVCLRLRQLLY